MELSASASLFGPVDAILGSNIEFVLLALAVLNAGTRLAAHRSNVHQVNQEDTEELSRYPALEATNVLLVLGSFYYTTLHYHGGVVLSVLVLSMVLTDFFEFEARQVELRNDLTFEKPKAAILASLLVLTYAAYQSLFFIIEPFWSSVV